MKRAKTQMEYKQNDLFRGDPATWGLNACVGRNGGPYSLRTYSLGYFEAGSRLAESISENPVSIDLIVYPLAFNYRHAIELCLKHLANVLPRIWGGNDAIKFSHRLSDNWKAVRGFIERDESFDAKQTIPVIDRILRDFLEIDPTGEAFRYPEARNGNKFLEDTSVINVKVLSEAMLMVANVFDFWIEIADALWDTRCNKMPCN